MSSIRDDLYLLQIVFRQPPTAVIDKHLSSAGSADPISRPFPCQQSVRSARINYQKLQYKNEHMLIVRTSGHRNLFGITGPLWNFWPFVQQLVSVGQTTKNTKRPHYWPFVRGTTICWWYSSQRANNVDVWCFLNVICPNTNKMLNKQYKW